MDRGSVFCVEGIWRFFLFSTSLLLDREEFLPFDFDLIQRLLMGGISRTCMNRQSIRLDSGSGTDLICLFFSFVRFLSFHRVEMEIPQIQETLNTQYSKRAVSSEQKKGAVGVLVEV